MKKWVIRNLKIIALRLNLAIFRCPKKWFIRLYQNGALRFNSDIFQMIGGKYGSSNI